MTTRVVSINIEREKHLDTVMDFLRKENPDIVCLMEVRQQDLGELAGDKYMHVRYSPNDSLTRFGGTGTLGVAILSKQPIVSSKTYYCEEIIAEYLDDKRDTHSPVCLVVQIGDMQIGSVHFSWTPDGHINERQWKHAIKLIDWLKSVGEVVLCGDFNAVQGEKVYVEMAKNFTDNLPQDVSSTIDPVLHRVNKDNHGKLALVVDYIFSTPKYRVSEVKVESRVSDHCALVCSVDLF
jgi:endonuclease/exonuclease/phosphatase family metal-dependent hydrolase